MLVQVRDSLPGAHMDMPVKAILARSRSRKHRRRLAQLSTAGVAAAGVLALSLTGVFSPGSHTPSPAAGTIRTAAFTLVSNADGTGIHPAAMPTGTELNFTYVNDDHMILAGLIYDNAHTCSPYRSGS